MDKSISNHQDKFNCKLDKVTLASPTLLPNATGFLWNQSMVMQVNCRGYVNSQFMQPEPAKYSYAPNMEAQSFIQPEHSYFSHHPGRFFYLKDEDSGEIISLPYEPMRITLDKYSFQLTASTISWFIEHDNLHIEIVVSLTKNDVVECWSFSVINNSNQRKNISVYPYFSIGYMSWMNQSASYNKDLKAIIAESVTPYQKVEDYFKNKNFNDKTFFISDTEPTAWHANQQSFEGEGGLHNPSAINAPLLNNVESRYESPVAVMQFQQSLAVAEKKTFRFLFGPAKNNAEILSIKEKYLGKKKLSETLKSFQAYTQQGKGCLLLHTGKTGQDNFVNHWLPRQMFYHGDVNRLSTDPQTRNYIQDNMGMAFIDAGKTRESYILAVSQQRISGAMPEGVLLHKEAELKYINQVPHADHGVWLPICLPVYLNETADLTIFDEHICFADSKNKVSFTEHIELALDYLIKSRDHRGLSFIEQGDWCDPMNMVGYKGKGVSSWLSMATSYALITWCDLCEEYGINANDEKLQYYRLTAEKINEAVNKYFWDNNWYGRGITDDGRLFGIEQDDEGKIFINPQSWSMLCGAANKTQETDMITAINKHLVTPQGVMMLAPSYTSMVEDVGRITQKHPGVSENGSVYNHAAIFYIYALYQSEKNNTAYNLLCKMLPSLETAEITGQLPVYIPNYYRGAYHQFPEHAGRSSHLFNTGTIAWVYRCLVEELCGLKGCATGLKISPKLPNTLMRISGQRSFRNATFDFTIVQVSGLANIDITIDGVKLVGNIFNNIEEKGHYILDVKMPMNDGAGIK